MSLSSRERNIMIAAVVAVAALSVAAFWLGRGSVGERLVTETVTARTVVTQTVTQEAPTQTTTTTTTLTTGTEPAGPVELVEWDASPKVVAGGAPITFTVKIKGGTQRVYMQVLGFDQPVELTKGSTEGGLTTWSATVNAPSYPGNSYRYYPSAIDRSGADIRPANISAASGYFEVT